MGFQLPDNSPDSVLITSFPSGEAKEVAEGSVDHAGGLQVASFPHISHVYPTFSRCWERGQGAPRYFYERQVTRSGQKSGPRFSCLLPDVFTQSVPVKLLGETGSSYIIYRLEEEDNFPTLQVPSLSAYNGLAIEPIDYLSKPT